MLAVGAVVALAPALSLEVGTDLPLVRTLSFVALVVGLTVAFLPMYYVFPDVPMTFGEALPGAAVAAVGWALLQGAFQVYVSMTSASRLYGVIGGVILFITWLYFGAVIVLLGGATNVVLSGREPSANYGVRE
jgi:membrane protein